MVTRSRVVAALALVIAAATLISTGGPTRPFSACLMCGFRWLADWLANVGMFIPLGCAMNWKQNRIGRTSLLSIAFSIAIEIAQTGIPGRDPSLSDILANSLGGALGALLGSRPSTWLAPTPRAADRLLALSIVLFISVVGATRWLLEPISNLPGGSQLSSPISALFRGETGVEFLIVSYPGSGERPLVLVGPPPPLEVLYMSRVGNDAVFRYRARARNLRLDAPEYPVSGFFEGVGESDRLRVRVSHRGSEWCLEWTLKRDCGIGPTVGRGWAVLIYPDSFGRRWGHLIDALWAATLFLPVGFWSRRRTVWLAMLAIVVILGPVARFVTLVPTPFTEWLGAVAGCGVGACLGIWLRRGQTFAVENA
jgi:hypothetical protein